ncbi:MAG: ATP-binding protein [Armatimonadota bacterium]|nr:MAG: ATP-binding protein [Armatimonadota bacterium]
MKQLLVISGKGGTGKTTVLGSFAVLAQHKLLADADVDAPNLHLLLQPKILCEEDYIGVKLAVKDDERCTECGVCEQHCRFGAITDLRVDPTRCEGCGVCALVCPAEAITMRDEVTGKIYLSETRHGPLVHARLLAGAEASGKLVTQVRERAKEAAARLGSGLILIDGSPGIGCPVIASLAGVDAALAVTEPTPSGLHDLKRVLQMAAHFGVPAAVCVNKWDINPELTEEIEQAAQGMAAPPLGRIPFDEAVADSTAEGVPLVEFVANGPARKAVVKLWETIVRS